MAKIADKHGLTNKYRTVGSGKRHVKRRRPRKYLFGAKKSRRRSTHRKNYNYEPVKFSFSDKTIILFIMLPILSLISWILFPYLLPAVIIFPLVVWTDAFLQRKWNLTTGIASVLWIVVSTFEAIFCVFYSMNIYWTEPSASTLPLWISIIVYIVLSILILMHRYKKIQVQKSNVNNNLSNDSNNNFQTVNKNKTMSSHPQSKIYKETPSFVTPEPIYTSDEIKAEQLCALLKKNTIVDLLFWNNLHLDFKYNLVVSYSSLQLNLEIINNSGITWYNGNSGIIIKVHFYDNGKNLLHIDDIYVDDEILAKNRFSDFMYFDVRDIETATSMEIYAYQDD